MYITNANENVKKIFEKLGELNDISKLKFLIYTFNALNNDQVNDKNEANPNLVEDEDIIIFNMESLGLDSSFGTIFLQHLVSLYNLTIDKNEIYEDNGNVIGLNYSKEEFELLSNFEKLNYNDKLDLYSELFIRYDNETYFNEKIEKVTFNLKFDGFDIAKSIISFKTH